MTNAENEDKAKKSALEVAPPMDTNSEHLEKSVEKTYTVENGGDETVEISELRATLAEALKDNEHSLQAQHEAVRARDELLREKMGKQIQAG